ncbi:hypothetical protein L914_06983 [Phytophthora nicotianae]|uniref:Uncharacterized protein n=1 Tax=Phytophthora nicotianae TaxID=4792 RepID=W2NIQ5_PHYNI|nr:hypothetical protein L914_06983 [Phytophthora nicotianae]
MLNSGTNHGFLGASNGHIVTKISSSITLGLGSNHYVDADTASSDCSKDAASTTGHKDEEVTSPAVDDDYAEELAVARGVTAASLRAPSVPRTPDFRFRLIA